MAKRTKPAQKRVKAAPKRKVTKKATKTQKARQPKRVAAGNTNPRRTKAKTGTVAQTPVNVRFYTVGEDAQILEALRTADAKTTKSALAADLAVKLGRSAESVRDRVKRYISKLSNADSKEVLKQAKKNPASFVYFKGKEGSKKIEKVAQDEPLLYNRDITRRPRISKKAKKPTKAKKVDFDWILRKVRASDPYFALDHSVHLLNSVFGKLMEEGVSKRDVENFVKNSEGEVTLYEILSSLAKK